MGTRSRVIPWNEVARVTLSPLADGPARSVNIMLQDGSRLSGDCSALRKRPWS